MKNDFYSDLRILYFVVVINVLIFITILLPQHFLDHFELRLIFTHIY